LVGPSLVDRINTPVKELASLTGKLPRFGEREGVTRAQAEHALATVALVTEDPTLGAAPVDLEIESPTVMVPTGEGELLDPLDAQHGRTSEQPSKRAGKSQDGAGSPDQHTVATTITRLANVRFIILPPPN
jgi:hypothetical protein